MTQMRHETDVAKQECQRKVAELEAMLNHRTKEVEILENQLKSLVGAQDMAVSTWMDSSSEYVLFVSKIDLIFR